MEKYKKISDSRTEHIQIVFSEYINGCGRLFGGKLMEWMDTVAAVVARRHSEREVTTASIDKVNFAVPANLNDTIYMVGELMSVGNTSMHVQIRAYVEKLNGERILINTAHFIMVALDENNMPCRVHRLEKE
jgi:acyl-CoA hydrolase